jgi:signal transduction histidine kinase
VVSKPIKRRSPRICLVNHCCRIFCAVPQGSRVDFLPTDLPKIAAIYTFKAVTGKSDIALATISPHSSRALASEDLQQQLQAIKHRFADAIWRSFIVIVLIGVPLSVARSFNSGWLPIYTLHLAYGLFIILIALNTKRISLQLKSFLLIFTFWVIGLPGTMTFGMASPGVWWLVVSCLMAHVLYSLKVAIAMASVTFFVLVAIAFAFVTGLLKLKVDANLYLTQMSSWATYLIVNSIMFFVVFRALLSYSETSKVTTKHLFRQWIDDLPLGVLVRDKHGQPYYQNQAATSMLGPLFQADTNSADKIVISGTDVPYPPEDMPGIRALRGETCVMEDIEVIKDGQRRQLQAWGRPGYNADGELAFGIASFQDITERKRLALLKDQFVSTVSHELRTPLTSIRGSLGLILGNAVGEPPPKMLEMLHITNRNAQRLLGIVDDILDLQKIEANQLEYHFQQVDLAQLLQNALQELESYASAHQVSFQLAVTAADSNLTADPDRLMQVLANLMSNAAKFSPANSSVLIHLEQPTAEQLRLTVTDQGPGIPESFKTRIFQPFSQSDAADNRARGGTGLGLTISKAVVEKHGGQIRYVSAAGEGSSFIVELPRHRQQPNETPHD